MSKSSRKPCARNNGVSLPQPTAVAKAVAAFPDVPPSPLTLVDSTSAVSTSAANEASSEVTKLDIRFKLGEVTKQQVRQVFDWLHAQSDIQPGTLWHTLPGSMRDRFVGHTITNFPYITQLMQQIGLLRYWGRHSTTMWQVIDQTFFDDMTIDHWFERSLVLVAHNDDLVDDFRRAKERIMALEQELTSAKTFSTEGATPATAATAADEPNEALMVQIAGLLDDIERSEVREKAQNERIAALERKLAEPPKVTVADVAQYLANRRAGKV